MSRGESLIAEILHTVLHLDVFLAEWTANFGPWVYLILFLIVFAETGLVLFPFLPGDSLLFALGAICSLEGGGLNYFLCWIVLFVAAFLGDNTNYQIGYRIGDRIKRIPNSVFFNQSSLAKTHVFFMRRRSFFMFKKKDPLTGKTSSFF